MEKTTFKNLTFSLLFGITVVFLMGFGKGEAITITGNITHISCPGENTGAIDISVSGAVGTPSYSWSGPDNFSSSNQDISNLIAGNYIVTVTDDSNVSASKEFTVTESDDEAPKNIALPDVIEECSATVSAPTTTDNCAGTITGTTSDPLTYSEQGTFEITWTFDDGNENSTSAIQKVIVDDKTAPETLEIPTATGECEVNVSAPTTTDNCAGTITGTTIDPLTYSEQGTFEITWTFDDGNGNSTTAIQKVIVDDKTAPETLEIPTATGECEVTVTAPTTTDNCVGTITGATTDPLSYSEQGEYEVNWKFDDGNGNITTVIQKVIVEDKTAPEAIEIPTATGECEVTITAPTTTDNCAGTITGTTTDPLTYSEQGEYQITWTFDDGNGNSTTSTQKVIVDDKTAPEAIEIPTATGECEVTVSAPTTTDNCVGTITGTTNDPLTYSEQGEYEITWNFDDGNGNSTSAIQKVIVDDKTAPNSIEIPTATGECEVTITAATTTDTCAGTITGTTSDPLTYSEQGEYEITWNFDDGNGNSTTAIQKVIVDDKTAPEAIEILTATGECEITVEVPTTTDNCAGTITGTTTDPLTYSEQGEYEIIWNFNDGNGNSTSAIQKVIVDDKTNPIPPTIEDITWGCTYTVTPPVATDNCTGEITGTTDKTTFSTPGGHQITWTFNDGNGNISTAVQNITIDPVKAEAEITPVLCKGFSTGEVTITGSGGIAPYTYTWTSLGSGATKTNLPAGTYEVIVSDANGCETAPLEVVISEPETFIEIVNVTTTTGCFEQNNGTATVEATGGIGTYSYLWDNGQTTKTATGLPPGEHTVTITDENGCENTKSITITTPEELIIPTVSTTQTTSFGTATGTATANISGGTGPYSFKWSTGANGQTARNLAAGIYSVTVTDANGCTDTKEFTIVDPLGAAIIPISKCLNDEGGIRTSTFETEFIRGGTAPYSVNWDFGEDASPKTATGRGVHIVDYSSTGNKTIILTVTDSKGLTYTETFVQYVGECFEACGKTGNLDLDLETFYVGKEDKTPLTGSECDTYTGKKYIYLKVEKNANAYNPSVEFIYTVTNLAKGTVVEVEEVTGCVDVGGTGKDEGKIPELFRVGEIAHWSCGYSIKIENFYMSWTNSRNKQCGDVRNMMCISTNENDEITFPLFAQGSSTHLLCYGASTGKITVSAAGGTGTYQYSLDGVNWQYSNVFTGISAGSYRAMVKDGGGEIVQTEELIISEPAHPLTIEKPIVQTSVSCFGGSDGSATVEVSGGTPFETGEPYIYVWSNNQTTPTATGLSAGEYFVTIIDSNGCEITETITIEEPPYIPSNAGSDQTLPCGITSTSLEAEIPEGETGHWEFINGPSGWNIQDVTNPNTVFSGTSGTYTLRWTVACGGTDDVKITFGNCSTIDFDGEDDYIKFGNNYNLPDEFSIGAWIKLKSTSGIKTVLSKKDFANSGSGGYSLIIEDGIPKFKWNEKTVTSGFSIDTNRWYHLAVISSSAEVKLYVDGIEVATSEQAAPTTNEMPFLLGAVYNSNTPLTPKNYFHGWIEEVRIWNTALTREQLHFMMNQRLVNNNGIVKGQVIPLNVPENLSWNLLTGYYHMDNAQGGFTKGVEGTPSVDGKLINITSVQERTAPLPYYSEAGGKWRDRETWDQNIGNEEEKYWTWPNDTGINGDTINWNIAKISHNINSGNQNITLLGLISEKGTLNMEGTLPPNESGNGVIITHYLDLDGIIDLNGESQLIQTEGSILAESSSGYIERDQQGTRSSFNYNYWSSPVSVQGEGNNSGYTIGSVLRGGTNPENSQEINFGNSPFYADGQRTNPIKISSYWLNTYTNFTSNTYSAWKQVKQTGAIKTGEGFTMKGTSGTAAISDRQNYVFIGKPNNGRITLQVTSGNDYLIGNPYPSAIDSDEFIRDNIAERREENIFNGALYFWDHFGGSSHYLKEYVGGYGVLNLLGDGIKAVATDERINATGAEALTAPQRFIPVGQGFYVSTQTDPRLDVAALGGEIIFKNSQRIFVTEQDKNESIFKSSQKNKIPKKQTDKRKKIWLKFHSPTGYNRQILVGVDSSATNGFDIGYDAPLFGNNKEDMYWMINDVEFVIQGVPDFNKEREIPLGIKTAVEGEFTVAIDELKNIPDDFEIYLKDSITQERHDLRESKFVATDTAGIKNNRYYLVFQNIKKPDPDTSGGDEDNDDGENEEGDGENSGDGGNGENEGDGEKPDETGEIQLYFVSNTHEVIIENPQLIPIEKAILYNFIGEELKIFQPIPESKLFKLPIRQNAVGVYVIKLELEEGTISKQFVIEGK